MKFKPYGQRHQFEDTARKRAIVATKQRKERDSLPLFAEEISEHQPAIDEVMRRRATMWNNQDASMRSFRAQQWRDVRRRFYQLPQEQRRAVRAAAAQYGGPLNPVAYAYLIRKEKENNYGTR